MGFDIPMNTKGAMDSNSLLSLNNGSMNSQPQSNYSPQSQQVNMQSQSVPLQPVNSQSSVPVTKQRPSGTGVHLKKGQKINLAQNNQSLTNIQVCLGWDVTNGACDLDASAFLLGSNNTIIGDDWFVFYGQPCSPDNSVCHSGDSTGEGVGDDEIISINLLSLNPNVQKIVFVVTINEAFERNLNFSMVANAYVRVVDMSTGQELIKFTLSDYYANVTSMVVGELYSHNGTWKFNAVGDGVSKDLAGLCAMYGVRVAD